MKFSTREDIAAPTDHVFDRLSAFEHIRRAALRRGAEVARTDHLRTPGMGMTWNIGFDWRGKRRRAVVELTEYLPPRRLVFDVTGQAFAGMLAISLIQLSPRRTRLLAELEFRPRTMAARLIIQSLRLTRSRLNRRFGERVGGFARLIEAGYANGRENPVPAPGPGNDRG